jgi:hypothetical protein
MSNFTPSLEEMQSYLPGWWQQYNTTSNLYKWLSALGIVTDSISTAFDEVYTNGNLSTATAQAIYDEWAYVWGVQQEFAPPGAEETIFTAQELVAYIKLLAQATGSTESLITSLLALLETPANTEGTALEFPVSGEGLEFPVNGEGLTMFQPSSFYLGVLFPSSGEGLLFPENGEGLLFPEGPAALEIIEEDGSYHFVVKVNEVLVFNREAFQRAIQRQAMAHLTWTVEEFNESPAE